MSSDENENPPIGIPENFGATQPPADNTEETSGGNTEVVSNPADVYVEAPPTDDPPHSSTISPQIKADLHVAAADVEEKINQFYTLINQHLGNLPAQVGQALQEAGSALSKDIANLRKGILSL